MLRTVRMVDWQGLLTPHAVLENVIRASAVYLMLFALLRFLPNRKSGSLGPRDLLVVVLLATAVFRALMRDEGSSITDAAIVILTIAAWSILLDVLENRVPALAPILRSPAVALIRNGTILRANLRGELMTEEELMAQLRLQGIEDVKDVTLASVEHDGRISIIRRDGAGPKGARSRTAVG